MDKFRAIPDKIASILGLTEPFPASDHAFSNDNESRSPHPDDEDDDLLGEIVDKDGVTYKVTGYGDSRSYKIVARNAGTRGCYVNLRWITPPTLELIDIKVSGHVRNRGIGTQVLNVVIDFARAHELTKIKGFVNKTDADKTSYLLDWYRKNGFILKESSPGSGVAALLWRPVAL